MALFIDGPTPTIDDLVDEDSGLLATAENAGINVTAKLRLAHEALATEIRLWLNKQRPMTEILWAPALQIEQVVATQPLRIWEGFEALAMVYRDAYYSSLVDRYQAKWQEYVELSRNARESFLASGLALVADPVARPVPPVLSAIQGSYPAGTYYVSVAGVNAAGKEGAPSWPSSITTAAAGAVVVSPSTWPKNSLYFRVYAGNSLNGMVRQNSADIPAGQTFTYLPGHITSGSGPGYGQSPEFVRPMARTIPRG